MKWFLLTVGVFVCVVALCAAAPWPAMLGVADAVGHSVEAVVNGIEHLAGRRAVHVDGARDRPGSPRNEVFAADLFGRVRVIDGDTIDIGGSRVRMHGVDAPESAQSCLAGGERWPCGSRATRALAQRIDGRTVACEQRDLDRYGRIVAECRQDGRNLNAWLVAEGWALAYRRYSRAIVPASTSQLEGLIQELARTLESMRTGVSPRYRFDERWTDLRLCLELDGYTEERDQFDEVQARFIPIEPNIGGAATVEDELTKELRRSGLPDVEGILQVLDRSGSAFRNGDFNGCLNNARVALQTLATLIACERRQDHAGEFDESKWGQVIAYLRTSGFISQQQEHGLAGVFGLISPGSHAPIGFDEEEFARLGRGLAVSIIYFLAIRRNANEV